MKDSLRCARKSIITTKQNSLLLNSQVIANIISDEIVSSAGEIVSSTSEIVSSVEIVSSS